MDVDLAKSIAADLAATNTGWGQPIYIDAGASGAVFSLEHPEHGTVALKIYDPKFFEGENALIEEARVALQTEMAELDHPHLIRTIEAKKIAAAGTWYLLMEFCPWPSMEKVVGQVPDNQVHVLIKQLTEAVIFLRDHGLVHRDIKPANIAVSPDFSQLKLLDLGVLRKISPEEGNGTDLDEKRRFVATAQYSPPEYIVREEPRGDAGFEALNVYQIGAVLHDLIMKRPLFDDEAKLLNRYILYRAIVQKTPTVFSSGVAPRINSICRASLAKSPVGRTRAVKLEHFLSTSDDAQAIRERLAVQRRPVTKTPRLSTLQWKTQVHAWVASAAGAEREILGAFTLKELRAQNSCLWELRFDNYSRSLLVELSHDPESARLVVAFCDPEQPGGRSPALEIHESGPNVPRDQIKAQLRDQMLYALDCLSPAGEEDEKKP